MLSLKNIFSTNTSYFKKLHTSQILNSAILIDGKKIAEEIKKELKQNVDTWINNGYKKPKLVAILVGNDPSSKVYVKNKMNAAKFIGIESNTISMDDEITQAQLIQQIVQLNEDPSVDGILVQLPLPKGIEQREICEAIIPEKDVDGFHSTNIGNLTLNNSSIIPATALAVVELIKRIHFDTIGKNAVIIGRSKHVGLPIALLLHADSKGESGALDMTTTICHRYTPKSELVRFTKSADLIVSAAGREHLITQEMVKPGACIIDVAIIQKDLQNIPGGVGPMTVAMLMKNTVNAAKRRAANVRAKVFMSN
ncbi:bifunctional methylenetetrahydrofolate dehydrogenase/cyclohydrolase, mitochondrial isoform X2 [Prorops nasuta]|uniref:bifunctional methylenetetrahydrofolate dehydrogenase/cyclohydrolase, mitochondrial isoform X2 n=1 Tax=Prorops nasuta TaxID=863751 RepID=UPI0034CECADB